MNKRIEKFRNIRLLFLEIRHKIFYCIAMSILISVGMCFDGLLEIEYAVKNKALSVYYLFFNSIIYGGVFGPYMSTSLSMIPYGRSVIKDLKTNRIFYLVKKMGIRNYALIRFFGNIICGGVSVALGYAIFIGILMIRIPFISEQELERGFDILPYVLTFYDKGVWGHILVILINGFLTGVFWCLIGNAAIPYIMDEFVIITIPFFAKFCLKYLYELIQLPTNLSLTGWLSMKYIFIDEKVTMFLTVGRICLITWMSFVVFYIKLKGRVLNEQSYTNM